MLGLGMALCCRANTASPSRVHSRREFMFRSGPVATIWNLELRISTFFLFFLIEISCLAVLGKIWKVRLYVRPEAQQFLSALKPIR